ncbi:MAG: SDR family oxidoreductase [Nocardia sp.]|nr:SDR family oxidoreductase [Nocardia sp.]
MKLSETNPAPVLITGAAGGIGAAVARGFADGTRPLRLWDLDPDVHEVAARLRFEGIDAESAIVDVRDPGAVAKGFARSGAPSVVVHAAGVLQTGSALTLTAEQWEHCLGVNATGTMNVLRCAAREMVDVGGGAIVAVSSNAATTPRADMAAYCAAKAAATAFARALALEVAEYGVRVNIVSPGSTDTPMLRGMVGADTSAGMSERDRAGFIAGDIGKHRLGIPLRRVAEPEDIVGAVRFLASDAARHITMHDLRLDGGATLDM